MSENKQKTWKNSANKWAYLTNREGLLCVNALFVVAW